MSTDARLPSPTATARALVDRALAEVRTVSVAEARDLAARGEVCFIDVREGQEVVVTGRLPQALHVPRGVLEFSFDPTSPWHRPQCRSDGRLLLLYCGIGWRSALAAQSLQGLGIGPVAHLGGGIQAWLAAGGDTEPAEPGAA